MARTIQYVVDAAGVRVSNEDLVNFGSCPRAVIDPSTGRRSYWFRYGDISRLTLPQLQAAIGELASAGTSAGTKVMRVSTRPVNDFTPRPATNFFGLDEFSIDEPVVVKFSVRVG